MGSMAPSVSAALLAPAEELADGPGVGGPGVRVPDVGGEELDEAPAGPVAGVGDEGGDAGPRSAWRERVRGRFSFTFPDQASGRS